MEEKQLTVLQQAQSLHQDLMIQEQVAAQSLTQIAYDLKEIRDRRLYGELGYKDFEEYCEKATKTGKRQAYNLISLIEQYKLDGLSRLSYLGSTKLIALKALGNEEREALIESGQAENLSVRELKEEIERLKIEREKKEAEQLSLSDELESIKSELTKTKNQQNTKPENQHTEAEWKSILHEIQRKEKQLQEMEDKYYDIRDELNAERKKPIEVAVHEPSEEQLNAIRKEEAAKAKAEYEKKLEAAKAKVQSIAQTETEAPQSGSKEVIRLRIENIQREFNAAVEAIHNMPQYEQANYIRAFRSVLTACGKVLGNE